MTNFEHIKSMSIEEMVNFVGKRPFCYLETGDCDCIYGWHGCECEKHAREWLESEVNEMNETVRGE